ncbi:MAG: hypothetical protein A2W90_01400 [Bacteroidetes bacterium GWF2_42_66]|nr:MAG: hypothetical protein A2W92_00820 [Bacteroidetes bacterium GWA2_42_15]OFY01030.1 MAG: hypothetical protein A2W89_14890 [Bacteroidetes bacterium GWE2_42_39]OFY41871.1 MAG: hypothetical protein A2W90_01400 [Bacteroidetes bacterium GWF2_42_66]HBL77952.1 hypothetical protein [Prolixibacteraceae bacterium]HCR90173.1 hypothetical protein [Prolixibacteraceae bacterium]
MSMRMFFMSAFGLIKSTVKIEQEHELLLTAYNEYCKVEQSDELKELTEMEAFVQSEAFSRKKKEIESLVFKGSQEEALLKEFAVLSKNKNLQKFYKTGQSSELQRYMKIAGSETLSRYMTLKKYMEDGSFAAEKKKSDAEVFKGSPEEKILNEFKNLQKSKAIQVFFKINGSPELKRFQDFELSDELKIFTELKAKAGKGLADKNEKKQFEQLKKSAAIKYYFRFSGSSDYKIFKETDDSFIPQHFQELKRKVESADFQKRKAYLEDRRKFEKTEAFGKSEEYKKLKTSDDILFYQKFEKSSELKNYRQMENSKEKIRFEELKTLTSSKEFLTRKAYLEDTKKWEKTDEYGKFKRYNELKQLPNIQRYFKYKNNQELDFFKNWQLVFSDDFSAGKLDSSKWQTISYRGGQSLSKNYSQPGDLQAFTSGENIKTDGKTLKIETRKEKTKGLVWQLPFGFIEKEFNYSSGCVNSSGSFWGTRGIWEAKVKYTPLKGLVSVLFLAGEDNTQQVTLLETGAKNRLGLVSSKDGAGSGQTADISGLKTGQYYIFRLEWSEGKMRWKINNKEILTIDSQVPAIEMHLNAATIVVDEITSGLPYTFEFDWIRVYQKK